MLHHKQVHNNRHHDKMQRPMIEIVLVLQYPRSMKQKKIQSTNKIIHKPNAIIIYLHSNKTIINNYFFGEKICTNSCFILIGEFMIYILIHQWCFTNTVQKKAENKNQEIHWFERTNFFLFSKKHTHYHQEWLLSTMLFYVMPFFFFLFVYLDETYKIKACGLKSINFFQMMK